MPETAKTDTRGEFAFPSIGAEDYTLVVEAPGFAVWRRDSIHVLAGKRTTLDVSLAIASTTAQVNVEARPVEVAVSYVIRITGI